jgi:hypothetical protein
VIWVESNDSKITYVSGLLKKYLGVNFVHVRNKIFMNKKHYIELMFREFGMYDHKPKKKHKNQEKTQKTKDNNTKCAK